MILLGITACFFKKKRKNNQVPSEELQPLLNQSSNELKNNKFSNENQNDDVIVNTQYPKKRNHID